MLSRLDLDLSIHPDRIQLVDRKSGAFIDHRAERAFSSPERLIADERNLEHTLSHAIRRIMKGSFILFWPRVYVTIGDPPLGERERTALRTALSNTGFRTVIFENDDRE
jgi:hypothetical protein